MANKLDILIRNVKDNRPSAMTLLKNYLNSFELKELLYLLMENEVLLYELMGDEYNSYWNEELLSLSISDENEEPFHFKLPTHISSLEFLIGYTLFVDFLDDHEVENEKEMLQSLFSLTPVFHSYHLLEMSCMILISALHDPRQKISLGQLGSYLKVLQEEAHYHKTPGYLLLARLCFHLAVIKKEEISLLSDREDRESRAYPTNQKVMDAIQNERADVWQQIDATALIVVKYLEIAASLENESENEIHNAYLGESLALHNLFSLANITDLKKRYISELGLSTISLNPQTLSALISAELTDAQAQLKRHKTGIAIKRAQLLQPEVSQAMRQQGRNQYMETPRLTAARHGDLSKFKKTLVAGDMNLDAVDQTGNTVLHLAVLANAYPLVQFILEANNSLLDVKNNCGELAFDLAADDLKMRTLLSDAKKEKEEPISKSETFKNTITAHFFNRGNQSSKKADSTQKEKTDEQHRNDVESKDSIEGKNYKKL